MQGRRVPREFVARNGVEVRVDDIARTGDMSLSPRPMITMARAPEAASTPIEPGLIEIRARVTLTTSMK